MEDTSPTTRGDGETRFARQLQTLLKACLSDAYKVQVGKSLLYKLEIDVTGELRPKDWKTPKRGQFAFMTDLLIENADPVIPLVVVELKFGGFSTHDIITYSSKATRHKEIYPYMRYGFVVGGSKSLSKKFLTHNQGVDFAMAIPNAAGGSKLVELIKRQLRDAEKLVEMMRKTRASFTCYEKNIEIQ